MDSLLEVVGLCVCSSFLGLFTEYNSKVCAALQRQKLLQPQCVKAYFRVSSAACLALCAVEWCDMTFITANMAFGGCVQHGKTIGMPDHKFTVGSLLELLFCTNLAIIYCSGLQQLHADMKVWGLV